MTLDLTFPTTAQIAAALETLLDTAQRTYDATDREDKEERGFWRRQRNAFANALGDVKEGRLPLTIDNGYLLPSASRPGTFHRCWREGGVWLCSCESGENGQFHRHTALIGAIEYAIDLIEQELIDGGAVPDDTDPDDFSDVPAGPGEPKRAPRLDDDSTVRSLVDRLAAARKQRMAA
jgi:hypothetical protein